MTLTATNGTIDLTQTTGLTFNSGDGTGDTTVAFTGTLANVNAAIAGLTFSPTSSFSGAATLQVNVSDQGNTGTAAHRPTARP